MKAAALGVRLSGAFRWLVTAACGAESYALAHWPGSLFRRRSLPDPDRGEESGEHVRKLGIGLQPASMKARPLSETIRGGLVVLPC